MSSKKEKSYIVSSTKSTEDVQDIYGMIDDLYTKTLNKSVASGFKASIYKFLNIFGYIFITMAGAVITVFGFINQNFVCDNNVTKVTTHDNYQVPIIVLGLCIMIMKSLLALFSVEKQSYLLKKSSIHLNTLSRTTMSLKHANLSTPELQQRINEIHTAIDRIEMDLFGSDTITSLIDNL